MKHSFLVVLALIGAILACSGEEANLSITDMPRYVCPSATPRPTHTPLPTSLPDYPSYFDVNLTSPYYTSTITLQLSMQNAGGIYVQYAGPGWPGSDGRWIQIATSPLTATTSSWALAVPSTVNSVSMSVRADRVGGYHLLTAFRSSVYSTPPPYPCCAPPPILPTARPTYTPYPTPTPYVRFNDYFLGDMVYTTEQGSGLQVGFKLLSVTEQAAADPGQSLYIWSLLVKNIGTIPYTVFPPFQSYISVIRQADDSEQIGVWGPSLDAAQEAGLESVTEGWDMQDVNPGEVKTYTFVAYGPSGKAWKISYVMDMSQRDDGSGNPTEVPGSNIVSWINAVNTVCSGEIQEP